MVLEENSTVFDVLACLCALLDKAEERECAIHWMGASEQDVASVLEEYRLFMKVILNSTLNEYIFTVSDLVYLNQELARLQREKADRKDEIFLLAVEVERRIEKYADWQSESVFHEVKPLNRNTDVTGIMVYPCAHARWGQEKSERNRTRIWNARFTNYMIISKADAAPFEYVVHYWNDVGLIKSTRSGWELPVVLAPVSDDVMLKTYSSHTESGEVVRVEGVQREDIVSAKVLRIFDEIFEGQHSIIVFPEALGTREIIAEVKGRMRMHPEYCTLVLLPTLCENGVNSLLILGPGGVECLRQNKASPFVLVDREGNSAREDIVYDRRIHLLITEELGMMAFPICADLLDPEYFRVITQVGMVDTIICPSFSPGGQAFKDTMLKGIPLKILELYVNTCSAKQVSRGNGFAGEVAMVQVPYSREGELQVFEKGCGGQCTDAICYFDLKIVYGKGTFMVEHVHRCA